MKKHFKSFLYFIFKNAVLTRAEEMERKLQIRIQRLKNARAMFFDGSKKHHQQIMVDALEECVLEHNKMNTYFISTLFLKKNPDYREMAKRMPLYPKVLSEAKIKEKKLKIVK